MGMKNLGKMMETRQDRKIEIFNEQDPADGSLSLTGIIKDTYTDKVLVKVDWYYDLMELLSVLNKKCNEA